MRLCSFIRRLNILRQKNLIEEVPGVNNRNSVIQLTEAGEAAVIEGLDIWEQVQNKVKLIIGEENEPVLKQLYANIELLKSQLHL